MAWGKSARAGATGTRICAAVVGSMAALGAVASVAPLMAQDTATKQQARKGAVAFAIAPQPLVSAIVAFSSASGVNIVSAGVIPQSAQTSGVSGTLTPRQALDKLLAGTGYTYRFTGATSVTIVDPNSSDAGATVEGAIALDTIDVSGGGSSDAAAVGLPYETPGSVSYISAEQIERYRGTSPSDILKNAPGVYSGESRASGGLDVNIRGMQGQGRVPVTVDGAQNSTALYRGYQGISNSTFIDQDFIAGISIEKGPSMGPAGAGAIGGAVSMRTVNANDIIPAGEKFGTRMKIEAGTNTSGAWNKPKTSVMGYPSVNPPLEYNWKYKEDEVDRPSLFEIGSGSASIVTAARTQNVDLLAGFARRKAGNYHAGEKGSSAPRPVACDDGAGRPCFLDWYKTGLTAYLPGEEVLNTSQDSYSSLLKTTIRLQEDHTLELGYSKYDNLHGETYPNGFWNNIQSVSQMLPSYIGVETYTSRYHWKPANELIDFRWNMWATDLAEDSQTSTGLISKFAKMRGTDISNVSAFATELGDFSLQYGFSYVHEETGPAKLYTDGIPVREGERSESSVFSNAKWAPFEWLNLDAGLRYHHYESQNRRPGNTDSNQEDEALDYSAGVTIMPIKGIQVFGTFKNAARLPSLFESTGGFAVVVDPDIVPEVAQSWEAGANFILPDVLTDADSMKFKISYFDTDVSDYINRTRRRVCTVPTGCIYSWQYTDEMFISNIYAARFSGLDVSGRYDWGSFSVEANGSYYTAVEFCRTAANCKNSSLAADYATNHVPPKYSGSVTLTQKLFDDRLTLSGRVSHTGPRAAATENTGAGANPFIAMIPWKPFTLIDLWAAYKLHDAATLTLSVENLADVYYVDPLSLALMPSPGRTIRVGLTSDLSALTLGTLAGWNGDVTDGKPAYDWSGFYVGGHGGGLDAAVRAQDFTIINGGYPRDYQLEDVYGKVAGFQLGLNHQFENNFVLGIEGSMSFAKAERSTQTDDRNDEGFATKVNSIASLRMRGGYAVNNFLVYGMAGYAQGELEGSRGYNLRRTPMWLADATTYWGWTVGAGVEYAISKNVTLKGEYSFINLENGNFSPEESDGLTVSWDAKPKLDQILLGLNFKFP